MDDDPTNDSLISAKLTMRPVQFEYVPSSQPTTFTKEHLRHRSSTPSRTPRSAAEAAHFLQRIASSPSTTPYIDHSAEDTTNFLNKLTQGITPAPRARSASSKRNRSFDDVEPIKQSKLDATANLNDDAKDTDPPDKQELEVTSDDKIKDDINKEDKTDDDKIKDDMNKNDKTDDDTANDKTDDDKIKYDTNKNDKTDDDIANNAKEMEKSGGEPSPPLAFRL